MSFVLKTSGVTIRACRAVLDATIGALDSCVDWRNSQEMLDPDSEEEADARPGERTDWGHVRYLGTVVEWMVRLGSCIEAYGVLFKERVLLPDCFELPPSLARLLPTLQLEVTGFYVKVSQLNRKSSQLNPNLSQLNPNLSQLNSNLSQLNPNLSHNLTRTCHNLTRTCYN